MTRPDQFIADADPGFAGMLDRLHPAQLSPGIYASGENCTAEFGDVRHRWAVVMEQWGHADFMPGEPLACARWWEPATGTEALVVITDGIRTDGGRGRAWQVSPGSVPLEIPMNGHDVWGACRLVPTPTGLILTRIGNARHYFNQTAITEAGDTITLNCVPELVDGDRVYFGVVNDLQPNLPDLQGYTQYWVTVETGNKLKFYSGAACSDPAELIDLQAFTGTGQWYVERQPLNPPIGGAGALPLLLEASNSAGGTTNAFNAGFVSVPQVVDASIASGSALWSAPNHRFTAGQAVKLASAVVPFTTTLNYYVEPAGAHALYLHDAQVTALLGNIDPLTGVAYSPSKRLQAGGTSASNYLSPANYSGLPIVPLTEAIYFKNRLIGINARSNIAISDPGDLLHFTPYTGALSAMLGNGDELSVLFSLGRDNLVLSTSTQLLAVTNLDQASDYWRLIELSREFGCIAPLSVAQSGAVARFLARSGVIEAAVDGNGDPYVKEIPLSAPIQAKFAEIDWRQAHIACGAYFNNRYLLAVPLRGQAEGGEVNNCVFVWNFLTQNWDGYWTGASLQPVQFSRLKVGGEEVLCFLSATGHVLYFDPIGHQDLTLTSADGITYTSAAAEITMTLTTRGYTCGTPHVKQWDTAWLVVDTLNANWTLETISEGVNVTRTYRSAVTKEHTKFFKHGVADFNPASEGDRAALPYREDYSLKPTGPNLIPAGTVYLEVFGYNYWWNQVYLPAGDYYFEAGNATSSRPYGGDVTYGSYAFTTAAAGYFSFYSYAPNSALGDVVTAQVRAVGIQMPAAGLATEPHQTLPEPLRIPLHDRSRSLQFRFTNTQGSARLRSLAVDATLATRP